MTTLPSYERYSRQMVLKGFGKESQDKLSKSSVLVIGAGGLGCPCLQYLAAVGVGRIGILDFDKVSLDNLHRQILYRMEDLGQSKALRAKYHLKKLNPDILYETHEIRLSGENANNIIEDYDFIIDASDNFDTRYAVNDACVRLDKTIVYGALSSYEGQVAVFNLPEETGKRSACYRDVFPNPPAIHEIPNCAEAGVLGVLTGIVGSMMANETTKIITGYSKPLSNQMIIFDSKSNDIYKIDFTDLKNNIDRPTITPDSGFSDTSNTMVNMSVGIDRDSLCVLMKEGKADLVDIREPAEVPEFKDYHCIRIPMREVAERLNALRAENIILICQTGVRSAALAKELLSRSPTSKKIYSLEGGILHWQDLNNI